MKRSAIIIGFMLAPAGLSAQGLPVDFDADAFEADQPRAAAEPVTPAGPADGAPSRRSVRYGERTLSLDGTVRADAALLNAASRSGS